MAQAISIVTFAKLLTSFYLLVTQIPISITQGAAALPEFETKLKGLKSSLIGLEQAPAEIAPPRYRIIPAPEYKAKYGHPYDPQSLQVHRRAPHEHNLNLHYRKLEPDEIQNHQYIKPDDQPAYPSRLYRKPAEDDIPLRPYPKPAEEVFNFNGAGQYQIPEGDAISSNRQYRKPQDIPETETEAAPQNPPAATEVTTIEPPSIPTEPVPLSEPEPVNITEQQLKDQKMELLKLIDQVGFDKAVHIFDNRIKTELNPKGPAPTKQETQNVRNNVLNNITTYHIYKPLKPLSEVTEPPTTSTTLKPQFPDNVDSPIESEYRSSGDDDLKSAHDEQQEARQSREDTENHKAPKTNPVTIPTTQPMPTLPAHQDEPKTNPTTTTIKTTTKRTTTRRPPPPPHTRRFPIRPRPTFRKPSPKFAKTTTIKPTIKPTEAPKVNNQPEKNRRCPTLMEFKIGAVILWQNLKQVNNVFGGVHLVVEAIVEAIKSLGICFFAIGSDVIEAINHFFTVENDPNENDPEKNFLNSSRF